MVKALIFSQSGVGTHCLSGTEKALEKYGVGYSLATKINTATLKGYDVLFLPGGNSAASLYINNKNIDVDAIQTWQKTGGVVIATCSGAYAASAKVDGKYTGYGLAPNVNCKAYSHEGNLKVDLTKIGESVFNKNGSIVLSHENGPAFYIPSGKNATILANFGEGEYKGSPAIVVDENTGLFSIHPELEPFYPDLIYGLMEYLLNKGSDNMDFSVSDIVSAGDSVKSFVEKNSRLPNYVTMNNKQVTMPEFLYLSVCAVTQYNNNVTSKITYKSVLAAPTPSGSYTSGTLSKSVYLILANTIKNYISTNSKAPNNEDVTGLGTVPFNDLVNSFAKILSFIKTSNRLPNTLTIKQITTVKAKGPIQLALEDAFGTTFNTFKEFYALVLKYGAYSYYFDSKYTLKESIARIKLQRKAAKATGVKKVFHKVKLLRHKITNTFKSKFFSTSSYGLNCCNWAEVAQALAKEMDLDAYIYGIYCTVDKINHAMDLIENDWVDCAAGASDGYPYGKHWCNGDLTKNPAWCPYQKL